MAKLLLTPENQIQRLNQLLNHVESLKSLELKKLTKRPNEKAWNTLEVLEHLRISHSLYKDKIENVMSQLTESNEVPWEYRPNLWNRFVIEGQRPKGTKRPYKMKTLKKFEPLLEQQPTSSDANTVFNEFFEAYTNLKQAILQSRTKKITHKKITSAIGPVVKFHLPEAFEFLLCHAERHKVQMDEILASHT